MPRSSLPKHCAVDPRRRSPAWFRLKRMLGLRALSRRAAAVRLPGPSDGDTTTPSMPKHVRLRPAARDRPQRSRHHLPCQPNASYRPPDRAENGAHRQRRAAPTAGCGANVSCARRRRPRDSSTITSSPSTPAACRARETATTGWLAMEWVHGTDLSRYASRNRLLPEGVVVGICQRVALALDLAHRSGIVHRDIKPSNILFDPTTGTVKVTDFGSARVADTAATRSGLVMGTPAYMAPGATGGRGRHAAMRPLRTGRAAVRTAGGRSSVSRPIRWATCWPASPTRRRRACAMLRPELPPLLEDIVARLLAKTPGPGGRKAPTRSRSNCGSRAQQCASAEQPGSNGGRLAGYLRPALRLLASVPCTTWRLCTPFQGTIAS